MEKRQTSKATIFNLSYPIIWCTKDRREVLDRDIKKRLSELLNKKANQLSMEAKELDIMPDHVHLFTNTQPIQYQYLAIEKVQ